MAVEVRPVDAGEFHLIAHLHPAAAAHSGAIDHDRVDAHHGLDLVRPRGIGARLHHHRRADRNDLFDVGVPRHGDLDAVGDHALHARRTVVRAQDEFVAAGLELVFPENQILGPKTEDSDHIGAAFLEAARLGEDRRHAQAAANAHHLFGVADRAGDAHRADHRVQRRTDLAFLLHLPGGLADRLDYQRDGSLVLVEIRDGERNPLALLVEHDDHELPRPGGLGHQRMAHLQQVSGVGEILACHDLEIGHCSRHPIGPALPGLAIGVFWYWPASTGPPSCAPLTGSSRPALGLSELNPGHLPEAHAARGQPCRFREKTIQTNAIQRVCHPWCGAIIIQGFPGCFDPDQLPGHCRKNVRKDRLE